MMQEAIVAVIVTTAIVSLIFRYLPRRLRQRFRAKLIRLAHRHHWERLERKLVVRSLTDSARGDDCAACSACAPMARQGDVLSSITPEQLRRTIRR